MDMINHENNLDNYKEVGMEKGNEKIFDTIPAVHVTGTQVISEKALFRVTFTEKVTENSKAKERCAIIISIETAKLLQKTLTEHINHWEE